MTYSSGLTICQMQYIIDNHSKMSQAKIAHKLNYSQGSISRIYAQMGIFGQVIKAEPKPEPEIKPRIIRHFTPEAKAMLFKDYSVYV
jgi:DNA-binding MarR family transcriptional regulator